MIDLPYLSPLYFSVERGCRRLSGDRGESKSGKPYACINGHPGFPIVGSLGSAVHCHLSATMMTHPRPLSAAQRGEQLGCSGKRRRSKGRFDLMDNDWFTVLVPSLLFCREGMSSACRRQGESKSGKPHAIINGHPGFPIVGPLGSAVHCHCLPQRWLTPGPSLLRKEGSSSVVVGMAEVKRKLHLGKKKCVMNDHKTITALARELRKNQTDEEKLLWQSIRNRKLQGLKFLRQHPIIYGSDHNGRTRFFVADFYCAEKKLVIEIDGKIHDFRKEYDRNRDLILKELNLRVLRLKSEELRDMKSVKKRIVEANWLQI
jgi:very-short-patch-repair endonuclease